MIMPNGILFDYKNNLFINSILGIKNYLSLNVIK